MIKSINIRTKSRTEFQDITRRIQDIVTSTTVKSGVCYIFVPHTTTGITINEHADPNVVEDIATQLDKLVPQHHNYRHLEDNSPAHIKTSLSGSAETLLIEAGKLVLGTWQGIFFSEFDRPRKRTILVKITRDKA
ncbi:secondary thiamine-phosphate synthase enzyme YjbQ [Chloroflexota bacterium]